MLSLRPPVDEIIADVAKHCIAEIDEVFKRVPHINVLTWDRLLSHAILKAEQLVRDFVRETQEQARITVPHVPEGKVLDVDPPDFYEQAIANLNALNEQYRQSSVRKASSIEEIRTLITYWVRIILLRGALQIIGARLPTPLSDNTLETLDTYITTVFSLLRTNYGITDGFVKEETQQRAVPSTSTQQVYTTDAAAPGFLLYKPLL